MFEEVLKMQNGANYLLADLHVHTPVDKRFRGINGVDPHTEDGKVIYAKKYIETAQSRGIKLLGITEHNDVSFVDAIRAAAKETDITIFPGFEISADAGAGGIHIIALFNPNTNKEFLDDIITQLGLPRDRRFHGDGSPRLSNEQLDELVEHITKAGGICIAAHVSSDHGILNSESMKGESRIKAWTNENLVAAEISSLRTELKGFEGNVFENKHALYKRKRQIAAVYSSDARSFDDIGSRATHIKISNRTIEGLRQAFLDWDSRICHPDRINRTNFSKIICAVWDGGFLDGLKIHFNENLNCLIGGKGTGKSTVLETLRYVFGTDFAPEVERAKLQHEQILEEVFKKGSCIKVLVETPHPTPKQYVIERAYPHPPVVKNNRGVLLSNLKPSDIFAIEAYGQKEIYEISSNPRFQLSLIDRFVGNKLDALREEETSLLTQLKSNSAEYLKEYTAIDETKEQIGKLPKLEENLERYKKSGLPEKLEEKSLYEKELYTFQRIQSILEKADDNLDEATPLLMPDNPISDIEHLEDYPNKAIFNKISTEIEEARVNIDKHIKQIKKRIKKVETSVCGKKGYYNTWKKLYDAQEDRYAKLLQSLNKEYPGINPEGFIETESEINRLKPLRKTREEQQLKLDELINERKGLLDKLYQNRRQQFKIRNDVCAEINSELNGIMKIDLAYEAGTDSFISYLKGLRSEARQLEKIVESKEFSIPSFVQALRDGSAKLVELFGLTDASASKLCSKIDEEKLLELETFKLDTKTTISLNIGTKEKPKYHNTEHLSVGQKCTAILTLILLESPKPLIVDQPEDDLDNTFIFSDIVTKLRCEKVKRQFLVATHNANIPVLGDAELIVALRADADHGFVDEGHYGSIDDPLVREPVETILEGGREAFEFRKVKYGF